MNSNLERHYTSTDRVHTLIADAQTRGRVRIARAARKARKARAAEASLLRAENRPAPAPARPSWWRTLRVIVER